MNWLRDLLGIVFPYRAHLEAEIAYLRAQVAQQQRRADQLQELLQKNLEIQAKPAKIQMRQEANGKVFPVQPKGWDAVRTMRRLNPEPEPAEPEKEQASGL